MKRTIITLILAGALMTVFTGCGNSGAAEETTTAAVSEATTTADKALETDSPADVTEQTTPEETETEITAEADAEPVLVEQRTNGDWKYDVYTNYIEIVNYLGNAAEVAVPSEIDGTKVTSLAYGAFYSDKTLETVIIPDTVTSIGNHCFDECTALTSVTIPDSVTFIGASAFKHCVSLMEIDLPASVTTLENSLFIDCENLYYITVPVTVTAADIRVFENTPWLLEKASDFVVIGDGVLIDYSGEDSDVIIPSDVKYIADAFRNKKWVNSVYIPDSVTAIGHGAFDGCTGLTSVNIPESVTSIGNYAFACCDKVPSFYIPDSVTFLGEDVFYNCGFHVEILYKGTSWDKKTISSAVNG